jgi:mRNA-degrading endonuclease YafQ of YafQ-DinJ toxin-antitoxin module
MLEKDKDFVSNPHHSSLKTHQLTGDLKNLWSFSVDYDCRIIFYFESKTKIVFIDIGTHDDVY